MPSVRRPEAVLAIGLAVVGLATIPWAADDPPAAPAARLLAATLVLATCAALAFVRRHPLPVFVVTVATALAYGATGHEPFAVVVAPVTALYFVGLAGDRAQSWLAGAAAVTAVVAGGHVFGDERLISVESLVEGAAVLLPVAVGATVRARRAYVEEVARRAAEEERLRIARDIHDVLAHTVSTITVQAGVASHLLERDPQQAAQALAAIRSASRTALVELRAVLGALGGQPAPSAPAPRLADLPQLVEDRRAAGLPVLLQLGVGAAVVSEAVELAAYRIVQEALSNVARHAGNVATHVRVTAGSGQLEVEVCNDPAEIGHARPDADMGSGRGIRGMTERAAVFGGTLETGPTVQGGFVVRARLPVAVTA